jgi:uncharacterized iron-regulated membrane protein
LLLFLIGGSGALLVFEAQIDRALNPALSRVSSAQELLSLRELKSSLERQYPGYRVFEFNISERNDLAYAAYLESASGDGMTIAVNQYTGKSFGVWNSNRFTSKLHQFHTHLLMGRAGAAIVAWGSGFLLFMSISGLILWWRCKIFRINFQSTGPKFQYDVHSTIGIRFYLDSGWPGDNYEVGLAMAVALAERGYRYGHDFLYFAFPNAEHSERDWGQRLHLPFQFFGGGPAVISLLRETPLT